MLRSKLLVVGSLISLVAITQTIVAQTAEETSSRIQAAIKAGDYAAARSEIEKLQTANQSLFQSKNYSYLLARLAEKDGALPNAIKNYEATISSNSPVTDYSFWHLAHIARSSGDLVLEREYLRKLVHLAPSSFFYDAANLRIARSFFESKDYAAATTASRLLTSSKNAAIAREGLVLLGQSLANDQKYAEARDVFIKVVMQMPDASRPDDFALAAVRELDELGKRSDIPPVTLLEADHLLRASVYQFNRDFGGARLHYQAIIDANPQSGAIPNATYQLGRGLYLEGKYDEAVKLFQKVSSQYPQTQSARDAVSSLAASYIRLKRPDDAIAAYKDFIARFPDAPNPERTYLNIIDALHESARYAEALSWVQQTRAKFPNQLGSALALFAQQRIHLAQGSWADVVRDADELLKISDLGGTRVPGGTTPTEVLFLKAFAREQMGRTDDAISSYLVIPDGRNEYYGARATARLLLLAANDKSRAAISSRLAGLLNAAKTAQSQGQTDQARISLQSALRLTTDQTKRAELLNELRQTYELLPNYKLQAFQLFDSTVLENSNDPHQSVASQLFQLGLLDEAMPEILSARAATAKSPPNQSAAFTNEGYTLAVYSLRGGIPNRAVRFGEQYWKTIPADYVLEVAPKDLVELLYPVPFRESLLKHATTRNVDPRFVLSIIRQESRYQVDVKSVAAARGMMQFISSTANEIATQLKLNDFSQDDLYAPDTAILFGSQYLANLFQQFPNQPQAVAGSYNGGADNLARWIARSKSTEADRYVPEIGFSQTKDYVYKVLTNYWNYQRFYDAQLQPLSK